MNLWMGWRFSDIVSVLISATLFSMNIRPNMIMSITMQLVITTVWINWKIGKGKSLRTETKWSWRQLPILIVGERFHFRSFRCILKSFNWWIVKGHRLDITFLERKKIDHPKPLGIARDCQCWNHVQIKTPDRSDRMGKEKEVLSRKYWFTKMLMKSVEMLASRPSFIWPQITWLKWCRRQK